MLSAHADAHSSAFNSVGRPHPRDEFLLVNQFARTHRRTIEQAAYSAIRLSGHTIETFDFPSHFLSIHLKCRQDWSGNPAIAFQVLESRLSHLNVLNPQMRAQFDKSIASRDAMIEVAKKTVENLPEVAGSLTIYCTSGSLGCWSMTTIFVIPQVQIFRDMGILPDPHYEQWFLRLRTIVDKDHILVRAGSDADWWIGRMEKVGSKWKQIKLSDEEYQGCGYPEHPGLLY